MVLSDLQFQVAFRINIEDRQMRDRSSSVDDGDISVSRGDVSRIAVKRCGNGGILDNLVSEYYIARDALARRVAEKRKGPTSVTQQGALCVPEPVTVRTSSWRTRLISLA